MRSSFTLFACCLGSALLAADVGRADPMLIIPIGAPTFQLVDVHQFSAAIGTAADGYAEFGTTWQSILPAPKYQFLPGGFLAPGAPNAGPYTHDIADGLTHLGIPDQTVYTPSQFSNGKAVWTAFMLAPLPNTAVGSSSDSASGPILSNSVFPLTQAGSIFRNGSATPFDVYGNETIASAAGFDGWSHLPIDIAENADFLPPGASIDGNYHFDFTIKDANGNGYEVIGGFTVTPEPSGLALGGIAFVGALGFGWRRLRPARLA